jgi:ATP-dependent DNA helicase DinG
VIIGSKSFFTGIDIQGKALSCVVLDKLPFEVPTDPVMKALLRDTEKGFKHYQLGNMIILLKQIFGRLIRTKYDTGIFMIGDPRIAIGKTRYAQFIKDSFPFDATRTRSLDKLKNFWEEKCL